MLLIYECLFIYKRYCEIFVFVLFWSLYNSIYAVYFHVYGVLFKNESSYKSFWILCDLE